MEQRDPIRTVVIFSVKTPEGNEFIIELEQDPEDPGMRFEITNPNDDSDGELLTVDMKCKSIEAIKQFTDAMGYAAEYVEGLEREKIDQVPRISTEEYGKIAEVKTI